MTFEKVRSGTGGRALAAALLLASAAAGRADTVPGDDAKRVQTVIDAMKTGDVSGAVAKLGVGPQFDALAAHPELVYVLCDRAFRYDKQSSSADARRTLSSRLFDLATAAAQASPQDDRPRWALAETLVLRERAGPRTGADAWTQAADLLEKIHAGHPADGLSLSYAVSFLLEGACSESDSILPFTERAESLARKAMESQKDSPTLAVSLAASQFWAAKTLLATNKKVSRSELKTAIETLKPFATRPNAAIEATTAYNDVIAFGRSNGFVFPDRFVMAQHPTLDGSLQLDVPVSSRWSFLTVAATADTPSYDYVTEMSPEGVRRRQVLFRRYAWNQRYSFEEKNAVGGDNVRAITQGLLAMSVARVFAPGATASTPARHAIPRSLDGYFFDVRGTALGEGSAPGEQLHLRAYVLRGSKLACFAILVYVYGKDDDLGPEIEDVINSVRENDK